MLRRHSLALFACALVLPALRCAAAARYDAAFERRFAELRKDPPALYQFLYRMPKGGDLHNHLAGAVYAESLIRAAAEDHLCVSRKSLAFIRPPQVDQCGPDEYPASLAVNDNALRDPLIDSLSMRGFSPGAETAHDHFFNAFPKFQPVSKDHDGEFVAEVVRRAADQNESYLELMALAGASVVRLGQQVGLNESDLESTRNGLNVAGLTDAVAAYRARLDAMETARLKLLNCNDVPGSPECRLKVRYVFQVLREAPKASVFAQVMAGFGLAASDPRVAGVNFVQPEDGATAVRDYHLHMRMVDYAHHVYPSVHISLHAGELASGLVPPEDLRFHIREAVEIGHAERIGHGVDLPYERDAAGLLSEMRRNRICVEINLTSNDLILGVTGVHHPFLMYRRYGVPVALSTDDEGVSRTHLTQEFERAVLTYSLTYADVKQLARNSLEYAFAPAGEKDELKADLERRFRRFEAEAFPRVVRPQSRSQVRSQTDLHKPRENEPARTR